MATNSIPLTDIGGTAPFVREDGFIPYWKFPADRPTERVFLVIMPTNYANTPILKFNYATGKKDAVGDVYFTVSAWAIADGEDTEAESYDAVNAFTETVDTTALDLNYGTLALTNIDSAADEELLLIKIRRTPAHASDTIDAEVRLYPGLLLDYVIE